MKKQVIFLSLVLVIILVNLASAMKNPAAVYCVEMGYEFVVEKTSEGELGYCVFPDGSKCIDWAFLIGDCGIEKSYCEKEGYELKKIEDSKKCTNLGPTTKCSVCVLKDGNEKEVTSVMNLNFKEGICGDGKCVLGENEINCPEDCLRGIPELNIDSNLKEKTQKIILVPLIGVILSVVVIIGVLYFIIKSEDKGLVEDY